MWELDCEESWVLKNWCLWTVVWEMTLESPLDCKEIQPIHPKGDQSWVFIGRTDAEAETPILSLPHVKGWLIGKDPDVGEDWRWEEKGTTENEMVGWHHRLNGHEFGWTLGVGNGQGGLACCSPWGCKESDTTERLNWTELKQIWTKIRSSKHIRPLLDIVKNTYACSFLLLILPLILSSLPSPLNGKLLLLPSDIWRNPSTLSLSIYCSLSPINSPPQ